MKRKSAIYEDRKSAYKWYPEAAAAAGIPAVLTQYRELAKTSPEELTPKDSEPSNVCPFCGARVSGGKLRD